MRKPQANYVQLGQRLACKSRFIVVSFFNPSQTIQLYQVHPLSCMQMIRCFFLLLFRRLSARELLAKCSGIHFTSTFRILLSYYILTLHVSVVCGGKNENNGFFIDSLFIRRIVVEPTQKKHRKQRNDKKQKKNPNI